ncbi:hypothetical protein AB0J83_35180 [Actinoplanes sp. NPDC049596]|uniref:hypothetical protein n=1 Tax=unclassified Actinoplanes TaxID=2626549 RepID=UPI00342C0D18
MPAVPVPAMIASATGVAGLEVTRQLEDPKWGGTTAEELIDTLVGPLPTTS